MLNTVSNLQMKYGRRILTKIQVREAGRTPPPFPSIFFKPATCVHDHGEPVVIPKDLLLETIVDGETRQKEFTSDLLFDCAYLIYYLSQGTTLRKGSIIMTGTPGGKWHSHLDKK